MIRRIAPAVAALVALTVAGCQSALYVAPSTQGKQAAFIELPTYDGGFPNVHVQRLDGRWIASLSKRLAIAPGEHDMLITCEYTGALFDNHYFNREQLGFRVEAGRTYEVEVSKASKRRCQTRLVDKSRKVVVSETLNQYRNPLRD